MYDDVEGHAVAPVGSEVVEGHLVAVHVLPRPRQQRLLSRQTLLRVVALDNDFFNLKFILIIIIFPQIILGFVSPKL